MIPRLPATVRGPALMVCSASRDDRSSLCRSEDAQPRLDRLDDVESSQLPDRRVVLSLGGGVCDYGEGGFLAGALLAHACDRDVVTCEDPCDRTEHAGLIEYRQHHVVPDPGVVVWPQRCARPADRW